MVLFFPQKFNDFEIKLANEFFKRHNTTFNNLYAKRTFSNKLNSSDYYNCPEDESHKELKRLFDLWIQMANLLNVSYALTHGTLLGAWRDGEMIPYDSDLDIMMNHEEVPKLHQIIDKSFTQNDNKVHLTIQPEYLKPIDKRNRYLCTGEKVNSWYRDQCSFIEPLGRLIIGSELHIDLVGYKVVEGTVIFQTEDAKTDFDSNLILPYSHCRFLGHDTFCPKNSEELLKNIYGENLQPIKKCVNGSWT